MLNNIRRVTFIGSKQLGISALKKIYEISPSHLNSIITIDDQYDGDRCMLNEFNEFAKQTHNKISVLSDSSKLVRIIEDDRPDLCIVVGWYWLINKEILGKVPSGFVGIHASMLPKLRGGAPLVWAILNGFKETGASLFYFDKGMDSGDIIGQMKLEIKENDTIHDLLKNAESSIMKLLEESYPLVLNGRAVRICQDHSKASYCSQRRPEDGRISWQMTNVEIYNAIRAQAHPYPGAFCLTSHNKKLYLWSSKIFSQPYYGVPGLVVDVSKDEAIITCGKGAIILQSVQLEGEPIRSSHDIFKVGMRLY
jgi:methionyl-tRNA formyltransferase